MLKVWTDPGRWRCSSRCWSARSSPRSCRTRWWCWRCCPCWSAPRAGAASRPRGPDAGRIRGAARRHDDHDRHLDEPAGGQRGRGARPAGLRHVPFHRAGAAGVTVGLLFLWLVAPRMLPERDAPIRQAAPRIFKAMFFVGEDSWAVDRTLAELRERTGRRMNVSRVQRGDGLQVAKLPAMRLQAGDRLLVADTREHLKEFERLLGARMHSEFAGDDDQDEDDAVSSAAAARGAGGHAGFAAVRQDAVDDPFPAALTAAAPRHPPRHGGRHERGHGRLRGRGAAGGRRDPRAGAPGSPQGVARERQHAGARRPGRPAEDHARAAGAGPDGGDRAGGGHRLAAHQRQRDGRRGAADRDRAASAGARSRARCPRRWC
jgi:hypothetical protein